MARTLNEVGRFQETFYETRCLTQRRGGNACRAIQFIAKSPVDTNSPVTEPGDEGSSPHAVPTA